ncbi:hypothetical protein EMIHUDRAFT_215724 [Emiliania huxleyi CCMP1516]|uniref:AB hydrolase-1 domain-containing protein n=2 Tax=Emiliania huxleyi TaxID=2903 RepID=A0A0D3IGV0_EMIH1|nr:hypothetical protein EMIHUDRAFT_215724 [Emiliania huxleyi CCMP1516]EOD10485.1 hypothetical protein EMIHUDRAFT_215724 [Emiliania huxleyi CCMP1516]|eukprot:XP_005762914.1 hypothetical protein EMIHUDRAFT_215724 [Emiliania huxleyi CCMP1516]
MCGRGAASAALRTYVVDGAAAFADATFSRACPPSGGGSPRPRFSRLRAAGGCDARGCDARDWPGARRRGGAPPDDAQLWGRSRLGALADVAEWREWFTLLARRSLALREAGEAGTAVAERAQRGDARARLILCNTAGVLEEPAEYAAPRMLVRDATLRGEHAAPFAPVPLFGQPALDAFGAALVAALFPRVPALLDGIYGDRPANADEALAFAITQGACSPGAANVIGSGQKLATNRPLNEVLDGEAGGFGGPVLVPQGMNDKVSGPARASERADAFERLRPGVKVCRLEAGGHCPQDDAPEAVAAAILEFLPAVREYAQGDTSRGRAADGTAICSALLLPEPPAERLLPFCTADSYFSRSSLVMAASCLFAACAVAQRSTSQSARHRLAVHPSYV